MSEADIVKVIQGLIGPISGVVAAILVIALVGLGIFLRRYLEQKALQLATREDFKKLQSQVAESTRLVEGIKSELANQDWIKRELHNLRMRKLEELITLALNCTEDIDAFRNSAIEGRHYGAPRHHDRMLALAIVYLPELEPAVRRYWRALITHYQQLGAKAMEARNDGLNAWDNFLVDSNYADVNAAIENLKSEVATLLRETANGTVFQQALREQ